MDKIKLERIADKYNVPIQLLNELIKAADSLNTKNRKVGELTIYEDIIYKFLKQNNDY